MAETESKRADNLVKSASSYFTLLGPDGHVVRWLLPALVAFGSATSAAASNFMKPFGYIGWIVAALIGALLCALLMYVIEQIRFVRAKRLHPELYVSSNIDDRSNWATDLSIMSIRDVSCALAGVLPREFDMSARAQAFANEIQSRVNDGWVPIDNESSQRRGGMIVEVVGRPNFERKTVDQSQALYVLDVQRYCSHREWDFSWAHTSKRDPADKGIVVEIDQNPT